jgi:hypothetical protein
VLRREQWDAAAQLAGPVSDPQLAPLRKGPRLARPEEIKSRKQATRAAPPAWPPAASG